MGNALQGHWDDIVIVTKTGIVPSPDDPDVFLRDGRPETIKSQCEFSLKVLGTDHINVYLIHWPDYETPMDETMRAMEDLRGEGKIGHVGVSNFSTVLMDEARAVTPIVANQVGYHMLDRRHADEIIPYCAANGIGVMAYGSLAHGVLTGAFKPDHRFEEGDWRASRRTHSASPSSIPTTCPRPSRPSTKSPPPPSKSASQRRNWRCAGSWTSRRSQLP